MKKQLTFLILPIFITLIGACGPADSGTLMGDDPETDVFRQALVSTDDVKMEYRANGSASSGLNHGQRAVVGLMTANAVIHTQLVLGAHILLMREIVGYEPTARFANKRVWEVTEDDLFVRVTIERSDTPRGKRFEYKFDAQRGDGDLLRVLDGDVFRIDTRPQDFGKQGFGTVRFYLTNLNAVHPEEHQSTGTIRTVFRKVGNVRQVRVRIIDFIDPNDSQAPRFAEYEYTLLPNNAGGLRWFSIGDAKGDGAPFENVSIHSVWREDKSGIGNAFVFGGSLEVDFWNLNQCWDSKMFLSYQLLELPDLSVTDGELADCFDKPEVLEVPNYTEEIEDVDPKMPERHEAEETD